LKRSSGKQHQNFTASNAAMRGCSTQQQITASNKQNVCMGRRRTLCSTAMRSSQRRQCTLHPLPWRRQQRSWHPRKRMTAHHSDAPLSKWCVGTQSPFPAHAYMCMCKHVPGQCLVHANRKDAATLSQRWASLLSCEAASCLLWQ
jgi:hypothetical protein